MSHPKIHDFSLFFALGVDLVTSWRQEGAQSAPRPFQMSIFEGVGTILGSILEGFLKILELCFNIISELISHCMFYFP